MRRAAFFDLDGTLLLVNSAALWVARERRLGRLSLSQVARASLWLLAYRMSVVQIDSALREALQTIRGLDEEQMRLQTREWWAQEVARHAAPGAFDVLEQHRAAGDRLVLVTSSSPYAAEVAAEQFGLDDVLCTRYQVEAGRFTGEAVRPYCFGAGKVALAEIHAETHGLAMHESSFYTDSYTDLPLLEHVGFPYVVNPDPRLRWEARRRRWPVLDWRGARQASGG